MKVTVHFKPNTIENEEHNLYLNFLKFLQEKLPIRSDFDIFFLNKREVKMTTGSRHSDNKIYILANKRMNRDILRTIAHEWVHQYQMTILDREQGPEIGGKNEDEANSLAGRLIKMFERKYPNYEFDMYE